MKRLFLGAFALILSIAADATTLNPIQLLNPAGSSSGQAIVSTGASTAPIWGGVGVNGIAAIGANTVLANATAGSASPTAFAMPSCVQSGNAALNWASGTGFTCGTGYAPLASPTFTGTPVAPTATFGTNTTQIATTAFVQAAAGTGRLLNVQVLTATGTYTPTTGTNSVIVEIIGGGGAGGGTPATSAAQNAAGSGGGSGSWARGRLTSGFSGVTVTIGGGGTGVAGANGNAGGQSSFGALITAPGGPGGIVGALNTAGVFFTFGAASSSAATGGSIFNTAGNPGYSTVSSYNSFVQGGAGGSSPYGAGGVQLNASTVGNPATGKGAGGGGAAAGNSQAAFNGGNGTAGLCIVYEFN